MRLIVVESPNKVAKVQEYAGPEFTVLASSGHVRDLPPRDIGVRVEGGRFVPTWEVYDRSRGRVARIAAAARDATEVLLATDPDREGEAIAWHTAEACRIPHSKLRRITFNEITRRAVAEAVRRPGAIDTALVAAAINRRLVDRFVGYEVSPVLRDLDPRLKSAGRVQSPTLNFVVAREREREAFVSQKYWTVAVRYANGLEAGLLDGVPDDEGDGPGSSPTEGGEAGRTAPAVARLALRRFASRGEAEGLATELAASAHTVADLDERTRALGPPPPFVTDTLIAEANRMLGLSSDETMRAAQELFEQGLITYHRTDSVSVSEEGAAIAVRAITAWAPEALADGVVRHREAAGAQRAHECVRPSADGVAAVERADPLEGSAERAAAALLRLVTARFVASQARPALVASTLVRVDAGALSLFARGASVVDPGWTVFYGEYRAIEESRVPDMRVGERLTIAEWHVTECATSPPVRFTEASLVAKMKRSRIGRPSTYASTIKTLLEHGFVAVREREVAPTAAGAALVEALERLMPDLLSPEYTARTEAALDTVAGRAVAPDRMMAAWYEAHSSAVAHARVVAATLGGAVETAPCPVCGASMRRREGRFGPYERCPNDHKPAAETRPVGVVCPDCGAPMRHVDGRRGSFLGCTTFPKCRRTIDPARDRADGAPAPSAHSASTAESRPAPQPAAPMNDAFRASCPDCGARLVLRNRRDGGESFYGCESYPKCRRVVALDAIAALAAEPTVVRGCPACGGAIETGEERGVRVAVCAPTVVCYGCSHSMRLDPAAAGKFWRCSCPPDRVTTAALVARARIGHFFVAAGTDARGRDVYRPVRHEPECPACGAALDPSVSGETLVWACSCGERVEAPFGEGSWVLGASETVATAPRSTRPPPSPAPAPPSVKCERCRRPMSLKRGVRGPFLSCTGYPECRATLDVDADGNPVGRVGRAASSDPRPVAAPKCPDCRVAMLLKRGANGDFFGCKNYPRCGRTIDAEAHPRRRAAHRDTQSLIAPLLAAVAKQTASSGATVAPTSPVVERGARACPECGSAMQEKIGARGAFLGCTAYPRCQHTEPVPGEPAV